MRLQHVFATVAALTLFNVLGCADDAAGIATTVQDPSVSDPAGTFVKYIAVVEAGDGNAVLALLSDNPTRPSYPGCSSDLSNRACLFLYLNDTVVTQHTKFTQKSLNVTKNLVAASLEVRSDLTRTMGIDRIVGTDDVDVVDGKINSLLFAADFTDEQTSRFFTALGIGPSSTP